MTAPTTYEIVIKGRATARFLRPLLHDFRVEHAPTDPASIAAGDGVTRLVGIVRDAAHLHGVVAHLTSVGVELISIAPLVQTSVQTSPQPSPQTSPQPSPQPSHTTIETSTTS